MKPPTFEDTLEADVSTDQVLLDFDYNKEAEGFVDWWNQVGFELFEAWYEAQKTKG